MEEVSEVAGTGGGSWGPCHEVVIQVVQDGVDRVIVFEDPLDGCGHLVEEERGRPQTEW